MIQAQTYLKITDNSGARDIMCLRVLGSNKKYGQVGDIIIGVVKKILTNKNTKSFSSINIKDKIKRSDIVRAVIVRTKQKIKRVNGMSVRFDDNAAIIINNDNTPKGTRFFGAISKEIRDKNFFKIASMATELV